MTEIERIEGLLTTSSPLPWVLETQKSTHYPEGYDIPGRLHCRHRIISSEHAFLYGLSDDTMEEVLANADLFSQSKELVSVLLRCLIDAAGGKDKAEFLILHHMKALGQEMGALPRPTVLEKISTEK